MAFFDDLGKKISQGSQSAVQKTKDMVEIAGLNGQIADAEKSLNNYYYQIGKLYVSKYRDHYDAEFAKLMNEVKQTEEKIRRCNYRVQDLKGIVRCAKCRAEVPNTASFCNACGAPIAKPAPAPVQNLSVETALVMCSSCGTAIDKNNRFCTSCGTPMGNAVPQITPEQMAPQPVTEPVAQQSAVRRCVNCGAPVPEDLEFCTMCGVQQKK